MSGDSRWTSGFATNVGKLERCVLGSTEVQVPECFLEQRHIFNTVMSQETWNKVLTESQRQHLMTFLPKFPENDNEEKRDTLRKLFNGENLKFGNPLQNFHRQLKDGSFSPDISKYTEMIRKMKQKEYREKQKRYYHNMLRDILLSRQRVFDQLTELGPDEPIKFEYDPPKQKNSPIKHRAQKKYKRYLDEVRQECGLDESSSDDELAGMSQKSKKQLFKTLNPVPSPEPVTPSVHSTYAAKTEYANGDIDTPVSSLKRPRPISPVDISEEGYREMLTKYKRRQLYDDYDDEDHPEYNTQNITLQDVMARCQASRKGGREPSDDDMSFTLSQPKGKVKKERNDKTPRKKMATKIRDMDRDASRTGDGDEADDESKNISVDGTEDEASTIDHSSLPPSEDRVDDPVRCSSFFVLIKNIILNSPDSRISTPKLENRIRSWLDAPMVDDNVWLQARDDWLEMVPLALKFLAGETIGVQVEQFIPFLDYKERAQQWCWIGYGRDGDETLTVLCEHWLKQREESAEIIVDSSQGSPPPPRWKTGYVVKATTDEEKTDFQKQEKLRFEEPHRAFMYDMHGYRSVVGPVKGVFTKKSDAAKAREHALLVNNRPAFVTILTLVRDAVARLPNGEGTRGDICELLKDSQFLAPDITDAQINVVVSGALDRLHSEKDPCVRYDVNRKVWIYLHRSRSEEEFERLHQAQAAAQKAKKSISRPKSTKSATPKLRDLTSSQPSATSTPMPPSLGPSMEGVTMDEGAAAPGSTHPVAMPTPQTQVVPRGGAQKARQASKVSNVTQSLTPAQLQLLQQAAAAQAALKAQAEAAQTAKATGPGKPRGSPKSDLTSKFQGQVKVLSQVPSAVTVTKGTVPPNVTLQAPPTLGGPQGVSLGQVFTSIPQMVATTSSTGSPVTMITSAQPGTNPLVAKLMQQMSAGGQMVSVSSLLAAQRSLQQTGQPRLNTAIKIQGGNVIQGMSGKSVQLAGKPLAQAKGQLLQIGGGKGQQTLGLIQTPQGTINIIPQAGTTGGLVNIPQPKGAEALKVGSPVTAVPHAGLSLNPGISQGKTVPQVSGGMVVTQLGSGGNYTVKTTGGQGKVVTTSQAGLLPGHLILQQTPTGLKTFEKQLSMDSTGSYSIVSTPNTSQAAPSSPSIQMMPTVLSQRAGLKPGQATILISQQALGQGGQVLSPGHILQAARPQGKAPTPGKQPMFARLITPQGNIKLASGVQAIQTQGQLIQTVGASGQTFSVPSDSALRQTLSKLVSVGGGGAPANVILTTGGTTASTISSSQQILAAAAAGKAALIKEMEKEKKQ
ncbi:nuclear factor related to kappa-B-binding protein-like isoform X2 [Mya arenaria]|uniref:nuclear factor related to kappa-B-binding protein-like isoform X2 n=1 Tax=Mya arenaria TaxID=6604 RepID=UPI0022E6F67C|nr:nuclear factor related to kappa-B-binding protein-like isoform X2 [Mya arenaria]